MFPDFLTSSQRLWLLALLGLWAVLLFGGWVGGRPNASRTRRMPLWTRLGSSFVLVIAAWIWFSLTRTGVMAEVSLPLALGMSFGFAADVVMAGEGKARKLGGIFLFAANHILYITALLRFASLAGLDAALPRWLTLILWWLLGLLLIYRILLRGQKWTILHAAALPYGLLLATTAGLALSLAVQAVAFAPLALGAALFVLSDLILAAAVLFGSLRLPFVHDIVWLTYGPAQMLIVYALGSMASQLAT